MRGALTRCRVYVGLSFHDPRNRHAGAPPDVQQRVALPEEVAPALGRHLMVLPSASRPFDVTDALMSLRHREDRALPWGARGNPRWDL